MHRQPPALRRRLRDRRAGRAARGCARRSCRSRCPGRRSARRRGHPRSAPRRAARIKELDDLACDVVVVRSLLHRAGLALHVHHDEPGARVGDDAEQIGVAEPGGHVVDDRGAGRNAAAATAALLVSMLTGTAPSAASASTTGSTRRSSSSGPTGSAPGPGRLAADVERGRLPRRPAPGRARRPLPGRGSGRRRRRSRGSR